MVVKVTLAEMKVAEVATTLSPDGRNRAPHLRSWRDGWRNLRFLLLYSPRWLFLYPGSALMIVGIAVGLWLLPGPRRLGAVTIDIHTLLYAALAIIVGYQAIIFAVFTKIFAITEGLLPEDPQLSNAFKFFTLEKGLSTGALSMLLGLGIAIYSVFDWRSHFFGALDPVRTIRLVACAMVMITLGVQTILASFFLSILALPRRG